MACRAIQGWTLSTLVGAYLDLALAYLLLCGAALSFIASKFLALFGLALPCPCDGLFVHHPTAMIASVQSSLRTRFPFDLRLVTNHDAASLHGLLEIEANESCASVSRSGPGSLTSSATSGLRRRRRRRASTPPPLPLLLPEEESSLTAFPFGRDDREMSGESSGPSDSGPYDSLEKEAALLQADARGDLERALQEERAARAALYLELEKERSAAATAADEAMAMILRLQEEKAAIEMESRQYRRMIEEKSAYDEEEKEILKEIVVRREMEKHYLEKEVEGYRQMMVYGGNDEKPLEDDTHLRGHQSSSASEDPVMMLHQIYESLGKKETADNMKKSPLSLAFAEDAVSSNCGDIEQAQIFEKHHLDVTDSGYESNLEYQEKGMVKMEASVVHSEEDGARENNTEVRLPFQDLYRESGQHADQKVNDSFQPEVESKILDVYAIDDRLNLGDRGNEKESCISQKRCVSGIHGKRVPAVESSGSSMIDLSNTKPVKSCSDMTRGTLLMDNSCEKPPIGLRRRSMSSVDNERSKLEIEVELLRKRLKVIQQGRQMLGSTMEHVEKESFQLQLLEEIAHQLQEIKNATGPGKSSRQASLPLPSSKVTSKKRRCRSVSWGVQDST